MFWIDPEDIERELENKGREIAYRRRRVRSVAVPNLIGLPYHSASDDCYRTNLVLRHEHVGDGPDGEGVVTSQEPPSGMMVKPGSIVTVGLRFHQPDDREFAPS